ncbi:TPA: hypothetical protein ACKAEE_000463 [Pseudomonas aeruginosa]|uniref:hypothetical protein n=1 Tax=Stutzerimonas degradans TaxID=2968968 RepID=UPI0014205346|nr:hypothetical protein [Stutzerimonas degradans]NHW03072.1 hypothetical protein [Stutzerimonas degradans]HEP9094839.1 hypothetical protein [Pseudomonas aeruginosa]
MLDQLRVSGIVTVGRVPGRISPHVIVQHADSLGQRIARLQPPKDLESCSVRGLNIIHGGSSKRGGRLPSLMISCSAGEAVRWEDAQGNILQWESPSPAFLKLLWHDERRPDATPKPTGHVVLVENRDTLLHLPTRLPAVLSGALVAHYEGWLSDRLLALLVSWEGAKIWLLPDLDPVGLANARRIAEALPCAGMLVPLLSPEIVDQYGDETIWRESFALVPALLPWLEQQDPPLRDLFALLKCKGRGVEQEYCLAVPSTVLEPIELRRG